MEKLAEMARRLRAKLENCYVKIKRYKGERRSGREEESRIQNANPATTKGSTVKESRGSGLRILQLLTGERQRGG